MSIETFESLSSLSLIRCKTCGKVLGHLYDRFVRERDLQALADQTEMEDELEGMEVASYEPNFTTPSERAFIKLGVHNECCRNNLNNPPRIPVGNYFFKPENTAPNTYIMGEYGKNYGDPKVLEHLNFNMTEESKRDQIRLGLKPIYSKYVSAGSQRYGSRFQPTLQERFSATIKAYINLNPTEAEYFKKALWHLFLFSMYARGWKGADTSYPIRSTGLPDMNKLSSQIQELKSGAQPSLQAIATGLKHYLSYINKSSEYNAIYEALVNYYNGKDTSTLFNLIDRFNLNILPNTNEEYATPNREKMDQEFNLFNEFITKTQGLTTIYRTLNSINYLTAPTKEIVKQTSSLHSRVSAISGSNRPISEEGTSLMSLSSNEDILDTARIVALTCYYVIELVSGSAIPDFRPSEITTSQSGMSFIAIPMALTPLYNE